MDYDYLIVGSGFFGSICAYELHKEGYRVCVIDSRSHIGGNCYTEEKDEIQIHSYGPHVFHTSDQKIWEWINQFAEFNPFILNTVANYEGEIYPLPFNMWTFSKLFGVSLPEEAKKIINDQGKEIITPSNLEEQAVKLVGTVAYEKLIKGYTEKQWKKNPKELPKEIIMRLPVRFTYDNNYFNDRYQGIPLGGYTQIFEKLLDGIEVRLKTDYFKDEIPPHKKLIYTGPIDRFYQYRFGELEYKTTRFEHFRLDVENYQGCPVMNFTSSNEKFTRIIEHKNFDKVDSDCTWITYEYPEEYVADKTEPYYPVNDPINNNKYKKYENLVEKEKNVFFGGRLAEYKYYDMHQVISSALNFIEDHIRKNRKVSLVPMGEEDLSFLLEVRNDDSTRKFLENDSVFTYDECLNWFRSNNPLWYIIKSKGKSVGYFRVNGNEIGCDIHPIYRRKGYAKSAYKLILEKMSTASLWVFEDNFAKNLYKELGFEENGDEKIIRNRKYLKMIYNNEQ